MPQRSRSSSPGPIAVRNHAVPTSGCPAKGISVAYPLRIGEPTFWERRYLHDSDSLSPRIWTLKS